MAVSIHTHVQTPTCKQEQARSELEAEFGLATTEEVEVSALCAVLLLKGACVWFDRDVACARL